MLDLPARSLSIVDHTVRPRLLGREQTGTGATLFPLATPCIVRVSTCHIALCRHSEAPSTPFSSPSFHNPSTPRPSTTPITLPFRCHDQMFCYRLACPGLLLTEGSQSDFDLPPKPTLGCDQHLNFSTANPPTPVHANKTAVVLVGLSRAIPHSVAPMVLYLHTHAAMTLLCNMLHNFGPTTPCQHARPSARTQTHRVLAVALHLCPAVNLHSCSAIASPLLKTKPLPSTPRVWYMQLRLCLSMPSVSFPLYARIRSIFPPTFTKSAHVVVLPLSVEPFSVASLTEQSSPGLFY